jgi:arabinose-5-phosphate isomerase
VLDGCVDREADPWDLVPTASTTVSLIVGDALAVAAMAARRFGPADFERHHPGGSLGRRLGGSPRASAVPR